MEKYQKPQIYIMAVLNKENISSLGEWLENAGEEYVDAGITTYVIES